MDFEGAIQSGEVARVLSILAEERAFYRKNLNSNFNGRAECFDPQKHALSTCSYDHFNAPERVFEAVKAQSAARNVLLLGDSVGRDTLNALRIAYPNVNFIMLHQSSCPPGHFRNPKRDRGCFEGLADMLANIKRAMKLDAIILAYRYRPKDWLHVEPTLPIVRRMCKNVVMLGVGPVFTKTLPEYIAEIGNVPRHIDKHNHDMIPWDFYDLADKAKRLARKYGITFADVHDFYLVDGAYPLWLDSTFDRPIYWDEIHLTRHSIPFFAMYLRRKKELDFLRRLDDGRPRSFLMRLGWPTSA
jgi:hypothetical protein